MRWIKLIIFALLVGLTTCVDPFIPETTRYESVFFVEALLSDDSVGQNIVKISYSIPVNSLANPIIGQIPTKVSGADVKVLKDDGEIIRFTEKAPGYYYAPDNWLPQRGPAYKLIVVFEENIYESGFQRMPEPSTIDHISYRTTLEPVGETGDLYEGYRFYVSTINERTEPSYYRWETISTYLYKSAYTATHVWTGREQLPASNSDVMYCWSQKSAKGIFTASSEGLIQNKIMNAPLHFESQYGDALSMRYSLLVKQFSINKEAWIFWSELAKQISQAGGLYESQPYRVLGNVSCITDPDQMVSGIFELASWSEMRVFVDKPTEFEIIPITCRLDTIGTRDLPWYRIPRGSYILYDVASNLYFYANPNCFDCTLKGGTTIKPPFWEDGE